MTNMLQALENIMTGNQWPILLELDCQENRADLSLQITEDLHWLKGHFPSQPVLPGVVQTHWATQLVLQIFSLEEAPRRIDNLKFQNAILPPQKVHLELVRSEASGSIAFRYRDPQSPSHIFSEGKLVF